MLVLKENLYRNLKIRDGDDPQEEASWTTEAVLYTWLSYSEVVLLPSLHPMILMTRPLLLHSVKTKKKSMITFNTIMKEGNISLIRLYT